jgi:6-pyruvoyltetrahydropterin/6-carboxytetrahydropterin synthase
MYTVTKRLEVSGAHCLSLPYESKCTNLHGHNWVIEVTCKRDTLDENGMVVDFTKIKDVVMQLDHAFINDVVHVNPTAENIAKWIHDQIPYCTKVSVQESEGNTATYED